MTNEELAVAVKRGDSSYMPVLWDRMQRMIQRKAKQYRNVLDDDFNRSVAADDLIQSGYFAVIESIKHFDPEKGFSFSTYLGYDLKNAFREEAGTKTGGKRDANNYALPLDLKCGEDDDGGVIDLIEDPENQVEDIEERIYTSELHNALDEALDLLTERQRIILIRRFHQGISYGQQAENEGISKQTVLYTAEEALEKIRRNEEIMSKLSSFLPYYDFDPMKFTGYSAWKEDGLSVQERHLIDLENRGCAPRERRWGENGATKAIHRKAMISAARHVSVIAEADIAFLRTDCGTSPGAKAVVEELLDHIGIVLQHLRSFAGLGGFLLPGAQHFQCPFKAAHILRITDIEMVFLVIVTKHGVDFLAHWLMPPSK